MGKILEVRGDRNQGQAALHLVTAWASEQRLVLGQVKVEDHSNEITAIPALLELLDLTGAIITLDAMGTQTKIVERIRHLWNETTHEIQFYLTSLPPDAELLCHAIRTHWSIENQLHWTLDVTFALISLSDSHFS
jgi:predicted transposase YbfD/YdcC